MKWIVNTNRFYFTACSVSVKSLSVIKIFELCNKLKVFLMEGDYAEKLTSSYIECVTDKKLVKTVSIFGKFFFGALNVFNLTRQSKDVHTFFVQDKLDVMVIKLQRWVLKEEQDSYEVF